MKRVIAVIDGLNLFHALESQRAGSGEIDVVSLVKRLINLQTETLVGVRYFSTLATHLTNARQNVQLKIHSAASMGGGEVALGAFKQLTLFCDACGHRTHKYVEKQTDVSVAVAIVEGAYEDIYDKVLLFSADTDLIPAIRLIKTKFPAKEIKLVSTVAYLRPVHATMGWLCDGQIRLGQDLVAPHVLK